LLLLLLSLLYTVAAFCHFMVVASSATIGAFAIATLSPIMIAVAVFYRVVFVPTVFCCCCDIRYRLSSMLATMPAQYA